MSTSTFKDLSTTKITQNLLSNLQGEARFLYLEFDYDYEDSREAALEIEKVFQNNYANTYETFPCFKTKIGEIHRLPLFQVNFANGGTFPRTKASRSKLSLRCSATIRPQDKREYVFYLDTLFLPICKTYTTILPNQNNPVKVIKALLPWASRFQWNHTTGAIQWMEGYLYKHQIPPTSPNNEANIEIYL